MSGGRLIIALITSMALSLVSVVAWHVTSTLQCLVVGFTFGMLSTIFWRKS